MDRRYSGRRSDPNAYSKDEYRVIAKKAEEAVNYDLSLTVILAYGYPPKYQPYGFIQ
jgi:hypothetical protein